MRKLFVLISFCVLCFSIASCDDDPETSTSSQTNDHDTEVENERGVEEDQEIVNAVNLTSFNVDQYYRVSSNFSNDVGSYYYFDASISPIYNYTYDQTAFITAKVELKVTYIPEGWSVSQTRTFSDTCSVSFNSYTVSHRTCSASIYIPSTVNLNNADMVYWASLSSASGKIVLP